jgi:predicted secreted Zn-dependent protease
MPRKKKKKHDEPLYDVLRFLMHDILKHCLEHWEAFSEAAKETKITPEQALASLLSKAVCEQLTSRGYATPSDN